MSIDEFIKSVYPKLKLHHREPIAGKTLKLTGVKSVGGQPIRDNTIYSIKVPIETNIDHRKKLRLAWLRGGKPAVKTYLEKFFDKEELEKLTSVI